MQCFLFSSPAQIFHILSTFWKFWRGSIIASPVIFNMWLLIISWLWALLGSRLQIIVNIIFISSFNTILREFNFYQVLIGSGISWWSENTVIFKNWALFCKKELKRLAFLLIPVTNFLSWKIGGLQGTFFSLNIFSNNDQ